MDHIKKQIKGYETSPGINSCEVVVQYTKVPDS